MRRNLIKIVLMGALLFDLLGCVNFSVNHRAYSYKGLIGKEYVHFYEADMNTENILEVKKDEGISVKYYDTRNDDLRLEKMEVTKNNKTTTYRNNSAGHKVLEKGQKEFYDYLDKILEIKAINH